MKQFPVITILWNVAFLSLFFSLSPQRAQGLTIGSEEQDSGKEITIAVAANFKKPFEEIKVLFQKRFPHWKIISLYGSSGHLTNQIRNGAPVDLFLSADLDFPNSLYEEGFSDSPPEVYAEGILVLVSNKSLGGYRNIEEILTSTETKTIAMANPRTAPYGKVTLEFLKELRVWKSIEGKMVYGESVTQVNQFVITSAADIGFTSYSSVKANEVEWNDWKPLDRKMVPSIRQGKILLKSQGPITNEKKLVLQQIYQLIGSKGLDPILKKYGYEIPNRTLERKLKGTKRGKSI
ncbi:molybdate ABC transporter substrate-binding protein [Leptospira jelokensis]|uniref:Molybdate ABC transporter substrate-binding protein n=1 Tax=Leptospira jelokensis TaxID=2484931 RepID=A0A4Z1A753_9LEPT|nr:molybdate ABC transporter substrate-binding protein [Leptospira jelokensis]TGL75673.1 molybdate ABC transporter substrate-binding protein [Leptospira jelokensis]